MLLQEVSGSSRLDLIQNRRSLDICAMAIQHLKTASPFIGSTFHA